MKKKKKGPEAIRRKSPEAILKKAEKLFKKGNYISAKKEFEEANEYYREDEIAEKVRICEREIVQLKAKELVKRGRKNIKKGNLREAIRCFEEAHDIFPEDWLPERISALKAELAGRKSFEAAKDAEKSGDYEKAASLYEEALASQDSEELLLKKASSLIRAEKYGEAISILKEHPLSDDSAKYDYGFALAKTRKYYECLKAWDAVQAWENTFMEQKRLVQSLLAADLCDRFSRVDADKSDHPEFAAIYKEGRYLTEHSAFDVQDSEFHSLPDILEYCKYKRIGQLWKKKEYEAIGDILTPYPTDMDADMLALYAKIFFKCSEISQKYLPDLTMLWLTALYHPELSEQLSDDPESRASVRQELIQRAEVLLQKHTRSGDMVCWNAEKKMMEDLKAIAGRSQSESGAILICTPRFAEKFGLSDRVLRLIRDNRDYFSDDEHYLLTGGCYSSGGKSLFHLYRKEYEEAIDALPRNDSEENAEFIQYCTERVHFAYGLHCLEKGDTRGGRYFENAAALFEKSPEYEVQFTDKAMVCHDVDKMTRYENALSEIHSGRPTKRIKEALSLIMTRRAVILYNRRQMSLKAAEAAVVKALSFNPKNEHARATLETMQIDLELDELFKAINKYKMNKACQIAGKSEYPEVREEFFDFVEHNLDQLEETDMDPHEKTFLLNDFFKWCARVDETHPILYDIDEMLKDLETS